MLKIILLLIVAYLLGSIPTGVWIGKKFYHKDIRDYGSGNIGTTNTFRVLGRNAGIVTFLGDMFKGTLATLLPILFGVTMLSPLLFGFVAILGHTFPIFAKFKGGKAVATSAGMLLGHVPLFFIYIMILFGCLLFLSSMVSFSSILSCLIASISVIVLPFFHTVILSTHEPLFIFLVLALSAFICIRHIDNVKRILKKTENTVPFGLNLLNMQKKEAAK